MTWAPEKPNGWYQLGMDGRVQHFWKRDEDMWRSLCGTRVIGTKHSAGLWEPMPPKWGRRGRRGTPQCNSCYNRFHNAPPIFPNAHHHGRDALCPKPES